MHKENLNPFLKSLPTNERVRVLLTLRRKKQGWLADQLGITDQTLSEKLAGRVRFSVNQLALVAKALEVKPGDLINEE